MASFDDLLASARLPENSVPICLRGDLVVQFEQLERDLVAAQEADAEDSLAAGGQARKIAEQIESLRAEMQAHTHRFAFRGLPRDRFRELVDEHPPRKNDQDDALMFANTRTFPLALIAATCIDPVMTLEQVEELAEVLTDGQLMEMFTCAFALNRISVDVPKSAAASAILAKPAPRSKPPARGVSAAAVSSAGNPAR